MNNEEQLRFLHEIPKGSLIQVSGMKYDHDNGLYRVLNHDEHGVAVERMGTKPIEKRPETRND
jgi:hypothetical protein